MPTWIACPRPASEPTSSPNTAPITATATATLAPENRNGSAEGSSRRRKQVQARGAERAHHLDLRRGRPTASPSSVLTTIGKKQISAITISFGVDAEAEPDHEDRARSRPPGSPARRPRAGRAARRSTGERCSATAIATPDHEREREAEQHLARASPRRRAASRSRSSTRARSRPRSGPAAGSSRPCPSRASSSQPPIRASARSASGASPLHASASSARSFSARELGRGDLLAARSRAIGSATGELGPHGARARREDQHAVAEEERLLDVVGDEQRPCGARRRALRRATPAARRA